MVIKKRRRWIGRVACLLACLLLFVHVGSAAAQGPEERVLKVAFPELEGISETDKYGNHTGLLVDYLDEIAKYTGWEYDYVAVSNEDLIDNFLNGQYDLMGGTFYSEGYEKYFAYPSYNTGRSRAVLLCRKDDDNLRGYDVESLNGKTIGVYENAGDKIRHLEEFLASNDLECQFKYYSYKDMGDAGNLYEQLRAGEVDMLLGNDQEIGGEFRLVTSFQAQPYYIVTTVGNKEILDGLNMALQHILESTPDFADEVYNANFPDVKMADIQLNEEELRYISEKGSLTVAVPKSLHPIYCQDSMLDHHDGMLPELLKEVSSFTGLEFTCVYTETYAESVQLVLQGEADILGAYLGLEEQAFSEGLALSQPYISLGNIVLKHKAVSYPASGLTCGVLSGRTLPASFEADEIRHYDTIPEMVAAVNSGEVDYIYGVSAMLEQEIQRHRYMNVVPVTQASDNTAVAFAAARPVTPELLTILNKSVSSISTEEKAAMLNRNLVSMGYSSLSLQEMIYANPVAFILILGCVLLLVMAVILLILRNKTKNTLMQSRLEAAEAKSVAKSEFLSRMSHEIRTPMNAIVGLTELAIREQDVPAELENKLKKIRGSSQYMLALINDILDMSRIENGKMDIEQRDFSLGGVLEELQGMMSPQAEQKGLKFQALYQIGHDRLVGDPLRLRQILTNLVANAVKFTPEGGMVSLRVEETGCEERTVEYHFSVQDTGIGIPKENQELIFTAFEQLRPAISRSEGTGLGLPISRSMARLMGGDIRVESEPGKGSEFCVTLRFPLGSGETYRESESAPEKCSLQGTRILLAEDNDLNAEIAQELLVIEGVEVCRVVNGQEAVDRFPASAPGEFQAILMDIQMPVMDGNEAARVIRGSGRRDNLIPIIAMTANSFKEDEEAAREAGMNGFVPKPVDVELLFSLLRELI